MVVCVADFEGRPDAHLQKLAQCPRLDYVDNDAGESHSVGRHGYSTNLSEACADSGPARCGRAYIAAACTMLAARSYSRALAV